MGPAAAKIWPYPAASRATCICGSYPPKQSASYPESYPGAIRGGIRQLSASYPQDIHSYPPGYRGAAHGECKQDSNADR
eukprot:3071427-Prymnesium_polylepis.1